MASYLRQVANVCAWAQVQYEVRHGKIKGKRAERRRCAELSDQNYKEMLQEMHQGSF